MSESLFTAAHVCCRMLKSLLFFVAESLQLAEQTAFEIEKPSGRSVMEKRKERKRQERLGVQCGMLVFFLLCYLYLKRCQVAKYICRIIVMIVMH